MHLTVLCSVANMTSEWSPCMPTAGITAVISAQVEIPNLASELSPAAWRNNLAAGTQGCPPCPTAPATAAVRRPRGGTAGGAASQGLLPRRASSPTPTSRSGASRTGLGSVAVRPSSWPAQKKWQRAKRETTQIYVEFFSSLTCSFLFH